MIFFPSPLEKVTLIKRYKRFLADIRRQDGTPLTVHCANSGSMISCFDTGWTGWISDSGNPKRKLRHTLEYTENPDTRICVNTSMANKVILEALAEHKIPELNGYAVYRGEVVYTKGTRFDGAFWQKTEGDPAGFFEIKTVSLCRNSRLSFPDAVTTRGQKHLRELMHAVNAGFRAVMIFLIMRTDGNSFSAADDIDPEYAALLQEAEKNGVEILVFRANLAQEGIGLGLPFKPAETSGNLLWKDG